MPHFIVSHIHAIEQERMLVGYLDDPQSCIIDKTMPLVYNNKKYPIKNIHVRGMDLIIVTTGLDCPKMARLLVQAAPAPKVDLKQLREHVYATQRRIHISQETIHALPRLDACS